MESETPVGATHAGAEKPITPAEAAQQKRILDLKAELAVIDLSVGRKPGRSGAAQTNDRRVPGARWTCLPTRESELVELTRDYSTMQAAYTNLLMKREDSMLAANLERRQIGEQFKLLDTASLPERPYNQVQRLGSHGLRRRGRDCVLGLLVVGLLEYRDHSFKCRRRGREGAVGAGARADSVDESPTASVERQDGAAG